MLTDGRQFTVQNLDQLHVLVSSAHKTTCHIYDLYSVESDVNKLNPSMFKVADKSNLKLDQFLVTLNDKLIPVFPLCSIFFIVSLCWFSCVDCIV